MASHNRAPDPDPAPGDAETPAAVAPVGRGVALLGSSNAVAFAAGILRQKVFAVILGPAGVGALSLAVSLYDTLGNALRLGVPTGMLREASRSLASGDVAQADRVFRGSRSVLLSVSGATVLAALLLRDWIAEFVLQGVLPGWSVPLIAAAVPLLLLANLSEAMLTAHRALLRLAIGKVTVTVASLLVMLVLVLRLGLDGAVIQIWTGAAVSALVAAWFLRGVFRSDRRRARQVPRSVANTALRAVLVIGVAEAAYHVAVAANLFLFRSLVVRELGLDQNGLYQVVLGLSRQWVPAVLGGVFVALYPRLSQVSGREGRDRAGAEIANALELVVIVGVPASLILLATRDVLITVLLAESFRGAEPLLRISAVGDVAALVAGVLHMSLLALGAVRGFLVAGFLLEGLYLLLVWTSLSPLGTVGPIYAYGVISGLSIAAYAALVRRQVPLGLSSRSWLRLTAGAALVGLAALVPGPGGLGRWVTLLVAGAWLWVHRARLQAELRR